VSVLETLVDAQQDPGRSSMHDPNTDSRALGSMFPGRLERCVGLAERIDVRVPRLRRLARHAASSADRACVTLGLERKARAAIRRASRSRVGVR
jgi:hypothetical protein